MKGKPEGKDLTKQPKLDYAELPKILFTLLNNRCVRLIHLSAMLIIFCPGDLR